MKIMLSILLTGILTENFILAKFLGICRSSACRRSSTPQSE